MPNTPKLPEDVEERLKAHYLVMDIGQLLKSGGIYGEKPWTGIHYMELRDFLAQELATFKAQVRREVIGEDEIVFDHRVGSHSDDWGGDSDLPCDCHTDASIRNKLRQQQRQALNDRLSIPSLKEASNE